MFHSPILRMTAGPINRINDPLIGMIQAPMGPGVSKYQGQLGQGIWLDDSNILFDSVMGTVYGGHFRYVRLAAASTAVVVGQIVFWDPTVADNLYQVTTSEAGSVDNAMFAAGVVLNSGWTAGNYGVIQDIGPTFVRFRAVLTSAGAIGSRVYCAGVGAGADNGFADVLSSAAPTLFSDVSLMQGRYLGVGVTAPVGGALRLVNLAIHNLKG
jgi:hypothetical protein